MATSKPKSNRQLAFVLALPLLLSIVWPWSYFLADSAPGEYHFYYPLWLLTLASLLLATGLIVSHIRRVRHYKPGCCDVCGYDLRASPGRCPECGTVRA
jgi:hypothetical protein